MIVRIRGARSGVVQYLVKGQKAGRLHARDQLDHRIVLDGSLETLQVLIDSIDGAGESYLHLTLSFAEPDITIEKVEAVTREFRELLMTAYRESEFYMYAEAHMPRLRSFTDLRTGEDIERLGHVHIVIPKTNLLTGQRLDPIGLADACVLHLDAIQEHLNAKHGLVSPKDRPREGVSTANILARNKVLDEFKKGSIDAFKQALRGLIAARSIYDRAGLAALLAEIGIVKTVNAGKGSREYFGVKPEGATRFINLREREFRDQIGAAPVKLSTSTVAPASVTRLTARPIRQCS